MADKQSALKAALAQIEKQYGKGAIMRLGQNTEMNELLCLSFGADDFVAKPYNPAILLLHIEAVFKRSGKTDKENELRCGGLVLDIGRSVMRVGENTTELTKNEFKILVYLMKNKGSIVSRDELINYLWDYGEFVDDNTLTVNINRVRKKLEEQGLDNVIKTKRGQGYIIDEV